MGHHTKRPEIWAEILDADSWFKAIDIHKNLNGVSLSAVKTYLRSLQAAGYLELKSPVLTSRSMQYRLKKTAEFAPDLDRYGWEILKGDKELNHMWRAMKMLGRFTPMDLVVHGSTNDVPLAKSKAIKYCKALANAEYLKLISDRHGENSEYFFLKSKNTGQHAPILRKVVVTGVFDLNKNQVQWPEKGRVV